MGCKCIEKHQKLYTILKHIQKMKKTIHKPQIPITVLDMKSIAEFHRVVKNYITMVKINNNK